MQSQRTHRKSVRLSRFKWSKQAIWLLKTCQITRTNTKQADVQTQKRQVFAQCQTFFYCQDQQKFQKHSEPWGSRGDLAPWILKFSAKKVIILVFSAKNKFNHFWPPGKILEKSPSAPHPGKNHSDAHVPNYDVHAKPLSKRPKWWQLAYENANLANPDVQVGSSSKVAAWSSCPWYSTLQEYLSRLQPHSTNWNAFYGPSKQHQLVKPMQ